MQGTGKKLLATLILFSFLALLPMSCGLVCLDSCGCGPSGKPVQLIIRSFSVSTVDGTGKAIEPKSPRPYTDIFKLLKVDRVDFFSQSIPKSSPSAFGTALACSPVPASSVNSLQLIQVINQKEFTLGNGTRFATGENLTPLFGINYLFATKLLPIPEFLGLGQKLTTENDFKIGLLQDPAKELTLEFSIRLVFDDGQEFLLADQLLAVSPK